MRAGILGFATRRRQPDTPPLPKDVRPGTFLPSTPTESVTTRCATPTHALPQPSRAPSFPRVRLGATSGRVIPRLP